MMRKITEFTNNHIRLPSAISISSVAPSIETRRIKIIPNVLGNKTTRFAIHSGIICTGKNVPLMISNRFCMMFAKGPTCLKISVNPPIT